MKTLLIVGMASALAMSMNMAGAAGATGADAAEAAPANEL
jgi:hypothetical protein